MINESEAASFVMKQFGGRIVLTVLAVAGASFALGAFLF